MVRRLIGKHFENLDAGLYEGTMAFDACSIYNLRALFDHYVIITMRNNFLLIVK